MSTSLAVQVLDLGLNNLTSLLRALREAGFTSLHVAANSTELRTSALLVLPGVGAFGAAMESLRTRDLEPHIQKHVADGRHLMGICLGMQLLLNTSSESPGARGLGLIPGAVERIPRQAGMRVPHVGWTSLTSVESPFEELRAGDDFYFVHSYVAQPTDEAAVIARAEYGTTQMVAAVMSGNVVGFQFHPEKSSRPGGRLLRQIKEWAHA